MFGIKILDMRLIDEHFGAASHAAQRERASSARRETGSFGTDTGAKEGSAPRILNHGRFAK